MSLLSRNKQRETRRVRRVRSKFASRGEKLRISVFRSLSNLYVQIIDDKAGNTVASCSSREVKNAGKGVEVAKLVGLELAKRAKAQGLGEMYFDRGPYLYHGRVKALADGLREGGLKF